MRRKKSMGMEEKRKGLEGSEEEECVFPTETGSDWKGILDEI
jgi:hypothetical protein